MAVTTVIPLPEFPSRQPRRVLAPGRGMSRPLLKLGGGSGEILRDVHL